MKIKNGIRLTSVMRNKRAVCRAFRIVTGAYQGLIRCLLLLLLLYDFNLHSVWCYPAFSLWGVGYMSGKIIRWFFSHAEEMHIFNATIGFHFTQKPHVEHNQLFWEVVRVIITQSHWQCEARPLFQWALSAFPMAACCLFVPNVV